MKTNLKRRQGFTLVELLVVIVIIAALAALTAPMVIRQRRKADQTQATNNARQIGMAMFEFEAEYGSFPDSSTADTVTKNTATSLTLGNSSSNDYFRQLIAAGIAQNEEMFYAKTSYTKKPDNVFNTPATALIAGENGFGYLLNGTSGFSVSGNSARPLAITPLLNAQTDGTCDPDMFDGKAVVLRMDNSVQSYSIRTTDKKVIVPGGRTLLETGDDTPWGSSGVTPTLSAPEKKSGAS